MMKALDLAKMLHAKRSEIRGWQVFVADVVDLETREGRITAYRIEAIEADEPAKEINLFIEYPDQPDSAEKAMTGEHFLDLLLPLASDNPNFTVEASIKVDLVIAGQRWVRYGMPLREIVGYEGSRTLLFAVEGLRQYCDGDVAGEK